MHKTRADVIKKRKFDGMHAEVLRLGSRVSSTRMEFRDATGKLLSTGCGAYIVS
jgi:acyl-coenzyme A thioesterase PaaI-like protein